MKIKTECVPCLIKRIIFEAQECSKDCDVQTKTIRNATRCLAELYNPDGVSAEIATEVHRVAYESLGNFDPYLSLKKQSNKVAKSLVPRVEELIRNSDDPLKSSIISAVVGNMMDFGISGGSATPDVLEKIFDKTYSAGLGYDDTDMMKKILDKSKNIMFFADNCGEIVFDKILCRELKKQYPDLFITLVVKGVPVLSDAVMQDAEDLGFDEVVDEILTTGCFAVGVDFIKLPQNVKTRLDNADLIICKGMANYESFSETGYHPIVYLMRTKCNAIADSMGIPVHINAVKLYK